MWAGALETLASLPWKERICCSRSGEAAPLVECLSSMWRALDQSLAPCKLDVMVGGSEEVQGHPQLCSEASLDYTRPYLKKKKGNAYIFIWICLFCREEICLSESKITQLVC